MERRIDGMRLVAVLLLVFMVEGGVVIWLLDLVAQQRIFGLLVAAEFVAFALLVGLYYEENPKDLNKKWLYSGIIALLAISLIAGVTVFSAVPAPLIPNVEITLYAGEISPTLYGFGFSRDNITSPGPTLTFKVGDTVKVTLNNAGQMPHNWMITGKNQTEAGVLFDAEVASDMVPLQAGQNASAIFKLTEPGNFFYICEIADHLQLGMWGNVVINP
jgi:plastocyanin